MKSRLAILALLTASCSALPSSLRPYRDTPPVSLLAEVDRHVYTPVSRGMQHMEADLWIDASGFIDAEKRPAAPLWLAVHFTWNNGAAKFEARNWPPAAAKLQQRVLALLQGKEDDLAGRPFTERLNGFRLSLAEGDDGLLWITAVHPTDVARSWRLAIDGDFHVRRSVIEDAGREVAAEIDYGPGSPAVMKNIASVETGLQPVRTTVRYEYGRAGKYTLPRRVVFQSTVGQTAFPPFVIEVKNIKAE
jgi:hypothetical protein